MKLAAVSPCLVALTVLLVIFPLTLVFRAVRVMIYTIAVGLVVLPISYREVKMMMEYTVIDIAVNVIELASA